MGASKVLWPQVALAGPQLLAPLLASVRRTAGGSPLVVATTSPEWAFGTLRLVHRLVDGVVLWGDESSPFERKGASVWESLFAAASRMEGDDESGLRVQVRFDLSTLDRLSAALLVGRRWAHWEPLPGRFQAQKRRPVALSAGYAGVMATLLTEPHTRVSPAFFKGVLAAAPALSVRLLPTVAAALLTLPTALDTTTL